MDEKCSYSEDYASEFDTLFLILASLQTQNTRLPPILTLHNQSAFLNMKQNICSDVISALRGKCTVQKESTYFESLNEDLFVKTFT